MTKEKLDNIAKGSPEYNKDFADAFQLLLELENFQWMDKSAITVPAMLEGKKVIVIIDTGCSGVIVSKGCINRLGLVAESQIEFTLNTAEGTVEKQCIVF